MQDTFLDAEHLSASFPQYSISFKAGAGQETPAPPFRITLPDQVPPPTWTASSAAKPAEAAAKAGEEGGAGEDGEGGKKGAASGDAAAANGGGSGSKPELKVETYVPPDPGPYPQDMPRMNHVRFTPVQVEAIMSGACVPAARWPATL